MLKNILKFNDLGNVDEIKFLLLEVLSCDALLSLSDLEQFCKSRSYRLNMIFHNLVYLLKELNIILINPSDEVQINCDIINSVEIKKDFDICIRILVKKIFELIEEEGLDELFINYESITFDTSIGKIIIKEHQIPLTYSSIKNLLISLGLFYYDENYNGLIIVEDRFSDFFERDIIELLKKSKKKNNKSKISLDLFREFLRQKEINGEEAEEYVVKFEQNRLNTHHFYDQIRKISKIDVGAGYDIISFKDLDSKIIDRFIEVKSYANNPEFYWTKNEIEISKEKSNEYYLYLVDRSQMDQYGYKPMMIENPFEKILHSDEWRKEVQVYHFKKLAK